MRLRTLFGAVFAAIATGQYPDENITTCMIPPGFPVEKWHHPIARPEANSTFAELAVEWYEELTSQSTKLAERVSHDTFSLDRSKIPWPLHPGTGLTEIRYCYMDRDTWQRIHAKLEDAFEVLYAQMGGPASAATSYSVRFSEVGSIAGPFCRVDGGAHGLYNWNPILPADTSWVESMAGGISAFSSNRFASRDPPIYWLNHLRIDEHVGTHDILHELMHVLD